MHFNNASYTQLMHNNTFQSLLCILNSIMIIYNQI